MIANKNVTELQFGMNMEFVVVNPSKHSKMKKKKTEKRFVYLGLGFPVTVVNAPLIEIRGGWSLDVDLNVLQRAVLLALAHRCEVLSGNQIRFIRLWMSCTLDEFGKLLGVTHPAVLKWEKAGDKPAKISLTTEREMRLLILDKLLGKDSDFRKAFRVIHTLKFTKSEEPPVIDAPINLIAS